MPRTNTVSERHLRSGEIFRKVTNGFRCEWAGVNLEQFFVSPTVAYQFAPGYSIGLSVNIAYQWFSAAGVGAFAPFSRAPSVARQSG